MISAAPSSPVDDAAPPVEPTPPGGSVLRRGVRLIVAAVRTHPGPFSLALAGATLFALMAVGSTIVLGRVTDHLVIPAFRDGATGAAVVGSVIAILVVAFLRAIGVVARRFFGGMTSFRTKVTWRHRVVDTYLAAPLAFHQSRPTGELMAHADIDVEAATDTINPVPFSLSAVVIALVALVRLCFVDPVLTLVGLTLFPLLAVANRLYTTRVEGPAGRVQARFGDVAAVAHESFDGALVVKTLGLGPHETRRLSTAADRLRGERLKVGFLRASFEPAFDLLPNLGVILLVALGSWRVSTGAVSTGALVEAMALFGVLTLPMRVLGYLLEELPRAVVSVDRLEEVLRTEPAPVPDPATTVALPPGPLGVEARAVRFGYDGAPVLDGLSFSVAPGEVVAVTGATGSGKSTLCLLLARLADPDDGVVALGGVDLRTADPAELRAAVAMVFQESFLFADTVTANLNLGAEIEPEQVTRATRLARADRFVAALPHGADTVLGERGISLSGGQRQRLALARALLRRPRLLLLDDATAAVDPRIEQQILAGLRDELAMTTVIVAHRVSTIALADRVLYLEQGRVAASGTHAELLATVPAYEALVRAYERTPEPEVDAEPEPEAEARVDAELGPVAR